MAPPPVTPSPHRFVTSKPANPRSRSSSSLRFQHGASQSTFSQQFTPAPRFNFSSTQKSTVENTIAVTQQVLHFSRRPHLAGAIPNRNWEDIEETGLHEEEPEGLENERHPFALPTQPTSKRRRPNPAEPVIISSDSCSPSPPPTPPPTTPPYPTIEEDDHEVVPHSDISSYARPRFVLPASKPPDTPPIPSRPPLILPPRSPTPPATTPAFFSPPRRGQKYVPGGLASTVRDWIVETSQQAHNRAHARRGEEELWDTSFRVGDCRVEDPGDGMVLVRERSNAKRWMLVGHGIGEAMVEVGCMVGIRGPTWEVQVLHESYMVAIEWKVLNR